MLRATRTVALVVMLLAALPSVAVASQPYSAASFSVHMGLSLVGLILAVFLLVESLAVRRLAAGGAVAERIGLVILAVVCLAASALADWATNFVVDLTLEQVQIASEVLVIVAMALLAAYFWNVRRVMTKFLRQMTDLPAQDLAELVDVQAEDVDDA